jgi:hypothetical protein
METQQRKEILDKEAKEMLDKDLMLLHEYTDLDCDGITKILRPQGPIYLVHTPYGDARLCGKDLLNRAKFREAIFNQLNFLIDVEQKEWRQVRRLLHCCINQIVPGKAQKAYDALQKVPEDSDL